MNILITGGTGGLGSEIVKILAQNTSNRVFFTYSKSLDKALSLCELNTNTESFHCDFSNPNSVEDFIDKISTIEIDVLINNAAIGFDKQYFHKLDHNVFLQSYQQNIIPTIQITQAFLVKARKRKFGKIINIISSANVNTPPIGWSEYVANKAYLQSLSNSWATENIRFNVTSNSISPSFMLTDLTSNTDSRIVEQMLENHPLKRILSPVEVAEAVLFYSKCSQQINGTNLVINAGNDLL